MNENTFRLEGKYLKAFGLLGAFTMLYMLSLLRSNFYYNDDLYRSLSGATDWGINGRPLMAGITMVFNDGMPLMDISPWGQLVPAGAIAYCLVLWGRKYLPEAGSWRLAGVLSFFYLNLFLLENLSYKYDALGMGLALCIPLVLFALPEEWPHRKLALATVAGVVALLSLYQAAIGAYLGLLLLEVLSYLTWGRSLRDIGGLCCRRLGYMLAGGVLYQLVVPRLFIPAGWHYTREHSALLNPLSGEGIDILWHNMAVFGAMLKDYGMSIKWLGILLVLAMLVAMGIQLRQVWERAAEGRVAKLVLSALVVLMPVLLVGSAIGALVLLRSPVFEPRVLLSLSVFTLYLGYMVYCLGQVRGLAYILTGLTVVCTLSLSSGYGNLLASQERLNYLVTSRIIWDISDLEVQQGWQFGRVTYVGEAPQSRELMLLSDKRPILGRLVRLQDWWTGGLYIDHYRLKPLLADYKDQVWEYSRSHQPVRSNEFYDMYVNQEQVIIEFREKQKKNF